MNFGIYAIKDTVTGMFGEPFLAINIGAAVRRFEFVCNQAQMIAADSQLYKLGEFNNETAEIKAKVEFIQSYVKTEA